jgi:hypothetical protein
VTVKLANELACFAGLGGLVAALLLTTSCIEDQDGLNELNLTGAALQAADSCDDVLGQLNARAIEESESALDANLEQALALARGQGGFCYDHFRVGPPLAGSPVDGSETAEDKASEYSTTNTQIAGVDEADFVKNDGEYIYILADGEFQILDAWPPQDARRISSFPVEGLPKKLFVHQDRAVIYSSLDPLAGDPQFGMAPGMARVGLVISPSPTDYSNECTYGYSCEFSGDGRALKVTTLDISDRENPSLLRESKFSGSYLNSRRIGDIVHTVVSFPAGPLPGLIFWPDKLAFMGYYGFCGDFPYSEDEVQAMFAELRERNRATIEDSDIFGFLPSIEDNRYTSSGVTTDERILDGCGNFYLTDARDGRGLLSLVSMDVTELDALGTTTIVGKPGAVYASADSLYIAVRHYREAMASWFYPDFSPNTEATTVHKFSLAADSTTTEYVGSGVSKGRILNQFSMDEHNGHLRIATTTGRVPSPEVHSTLSVLRQVGDALEVVGVIDNLAPTEDIRSVRFSGDTGFMVTFKKTDPLFVFDLSDPENPMARGELKIPGYSTYMHLMDDEHLLTIGYDAEDQGSFAWFQGVQLQMINVSDVDDPRLIHKKVIGTRGTSSEATTNHLAFNYYRQRGLLAIPITLCEESSGGGSYGQRMTFSGLLVYDISIEDGIDELGGVSHVEPEDGFVDRYDGHCGNWWTQSNSEVKRSIFMSSEVEDFVYSIATERMLIASLDDLEHPVSDIDLRLAPDE